MLTRGDRLGPYEILGPIGAGGMGEVYRARDPRLEREVAIKVLPADRMADQGRRARFVQEARAASALNHPNIVTIHEIGSEGGIDFIVMEYVAGKTLDHVRRRPLPAAEVLRLAVPMAGALARAHAAGIAHRDLKPSNVAVSEEGVVKILDFGLAKLVGPEEPSESPGEGTADTETASLGTRPGMVAGTAGYMSPEQASGGKVDARSDVFAFGVVLYEMVTGHRAFPGHSTAEVLAAVIKEQPRPPSERVPGVPQGLERLIMRCLRKEPERRPQHMADVKVELEDIRDEAIGGGAGPHLVKSRRRALVYTVLVILPVLLAILVLRRPSPMAYTVKLASTQRAAGAAFSPDGTQVVICRADPGQQNWDLWLRLVGGTEERRLTTDPADEGDAAWSPDGTQIAFVRNSSIYLVSPLGGPERRLVDFPASSGPSWSPDGRWLAVSRRRAEGEDSAESGGIQILPAVGGLPHVATRATPPTYHVSANFSPDGRTLAYSACEQSAGGPPVCDVYVVGLDSEAQVIGEPHRLTHEALWHTGLVWARDGRSLIYSDGFTERARLWRVAADGSAPPEEIPLTSGGAQPFVARNADRMGFLRNLTDVDICRLEGGSALTPVFASTAWEFLPEYSPDGRRIAFNSARETPWQEVFLADADGSNVTRLTREVSTKSGSGAPSWSPDGAFIAFDSQGQDARYDIWTIGVDGGELRQLTHGPAGGSVPSWSRDGRWIYFSSNRTGRFEIWRIPSQGGDEEQVTQQGGYFARESPDGQTLYFKRANGSSPLVARSASGGKERNVVDCVNGFGYSVTPAGILHLDCKYSPDSPEYRVLRLWSPQSGGDREIAPVETGRWMALGLAGSPDGRTVLLSRVNPKVDVMMIENFR